MRAFGPRSMPAKLLPALAGDADFPGVFGDARQRVVVVETPGRDHESLDAQRRELLDDGARGRIPASSPAFMEMMFRPIFMALSPETGVEWLLAWSVERGALHGLVGDRSAQVRRRQPAAAAVDRYGRTGDVAAGRRGQKNNGAGDIVGLSDAA